MTAKIAARLSRQDAGLAGHRTGFAGSDGRRLAALLIDWLIAYGLALLGVEFGVWSTPMLSTVVLVIWLLLGVAAVRLFGFTPGQLMLGLVVVAVGGRRPVGIGRLVVRGLLIGLVVPPLFTDSDGRGLHDRLTATAVVRR